MNFEVTHNNLPQAVELLLAKITLLEERIDAMARSESADVLMTVEEAAAFLKMQKQTLYKKMKRIPHHKEGKRCLFSRKVLTDWVAENHTTQDADFELRDKALAKKKRKLTTTKIKKSSAASDTTELRILTFKL